MASILDSVKKLLAVPDDYHYFDDVIVMHINSVFSILVQLGVGPDEGFAITGNSETWDDFIPEDSNLEMIKTYVYLKVRLMFDPPTNGSLIEAINRQVSELEWRINVQVDPKKKGEDMGVTI